MRKLEKTYSKSERIIVRARFSAWGFVFDFLLAAVLGGIIAVLWIFGGDIEKLFGGDGSASYLTPDNLKWAMLGCGALVLIVAMFRGIALASKELIVTEDKFLYKAGLGSALNVMLPLSEIRYIDVRQNALQSLLGFGKIMVITAGEQPLTIRNLVRPDRFARRVMKQCSLVRTSSHPRIQLSRNR